MKYLDVDPIRNAQLYLDGRGDQSKRYASWDHCFNYFRREFDEGRVVQIAGDNLQLSCLHLGFYLASWGMYRGRAALLQHSAQVLTPVVEVLSTSPSEIWSLDAERYDNNSLDLLLDCAHRVRQKLPGAASDTLVTKVMLGVFGNVPAFDRYYRKGFASNRLNKNSLTKVKDYFDKYREEVTSLQIPTLDFAGNETQYLYTQSKIIDMIFFVEGGGAG